MAWRIVCYIVFDCFDVFDVYIVMFVSVVRCVGNVRIHEMVDGQEQELVFEWAVIFICCGDRDSVVSA